MADNQPTLSPPEEWRPIPGFDGFYEASNHGRVRSVDRTITTKAGVRRRRKGTVLRPADNGCGYLVANLRHHDFGGTKTVHSLVLMAFVGERPDGTECCHNDGDPMNNRLDNLRWGTSKDNEDDKLKHGSECNSSKSECPRGHELVAPNLVVSHLKRGTRSCLACARTVAHVHNQKKRKGVDVSGEFQELADERYVKILDADADLLTL